MGLFGAATIVAQCFPLISAPILTRLYTPDAFGVYATYFAVTAISSVIASLSLHNAILTEKDDNTAFYALIVSLVPPIPIAATLWIGVWFMPSTIYSHWFDDSQKHLLHIVPITVLLACAHTAGYTWSLRMERYRLLAGNKLTLALSTMVVQISIGLLQIGALGLVLANLVGYTLALTLVYRRILQEDAWRLRGFASEHVMQLIRAHRSLALFTTPSSILNTLSSYLPDLMIGRFYGSAVLGHYSLGMRLVGMPLNFISSTVQDVFRQQAVREYHATGTCTRSFRRVLQLMTACSLIGLVPIVLLLPLVLPVALGPEWSASAAYVQCLLFLLVMRFVSSPLSYVWVITGRNRLDMYWQLGLVVIGAISFILPAMISWHITVETQFFIYASIAGLWYGLALICSYRWAQGK